MHFISSNQCSRTDVVCFSSHRIVSVYIAQSQHVKGERALALGWEPRAMPVVLEQWAEEGIKVAVEKVEN